MTGHYTQVQGRQSCDECRLWIQTGRYCHVGHATTRCSKQRYAVAGKAGDVWVARVRVGMAYDRHDDLNNEAVYARHYKYMAIMPLLHYTHLLLAESPYTYTTD